MSPYYAEFIGTLIIILLGDGAVAGALLKGTKSENDGWLTIVMAWGLAVTLAIFAVGRISGAHLNPAITIALYLTGDFPQDKVAGYIIAQFAGAFVGAILVWLHFLPHWERTDSASKKLAVFCTGPAVRSTPANLVSEVIATGVLVFAILFIGANEFAAGINPLIVGGLIISIGLSLGGTTGFAINPARDLGPRLAHFILPIPGKGSSDWSYSWIPVVGPVLGGVLGAWMFKALFV
ncbi:aquaporin family protein [Chryseolinea sp. Jin1]|uniref:Aquaporin family protein n=2 Tax=Chryseolinea lacunae TaxID=2801331 RepID=A0ABS1KWK2_9BACT|nr:MIP/aquaporin family protein [Chryseolinea lacunae]MBL0743627.1 aquaporin family protein [Chryseolinea lacunae]